MIFRNDDIGYHTKLDEFKRVNDIFLKHGVVHTVAILTRNLLKRQDLIDYLKEAGNFDCQFHGHDHRDFSQLSWDQLMEQFSEGKSAFELAGLPPAQIWFPCWNRVSVLAEEVAGVFGLMASWEKVSLDYYIEHKGGVVHPVINFHSWYIHEQLILEDALVIYKQLEK